MSTDDKENHDTLAPLLKVNDFQKKAPINLRWAIQQKMVEWKVLVRYGRKLLIDPDRFWDWLRSRG